MRDVTTYLCPGCAIKNDDDFTSINCLTCHHSNQSHIQTIITKTIKDQRRVKEPDEYSKV